ncbi:MAG: DUF2147 domain-containing protein [Pseudomonadota bacterium]
MIRILSILLLFAGSPSLADIGGEWIPPSGDAVLSIEVGETVDIYLQATLDPRLDEHNPRPSLRQRPLIGLKIGSGFQRRADGWHGGRVYDPAGGRTYSAVLKQLDADRLEVRGYLGIRLMGRTQIWTRREVWHRRVNAMLGEVCHHAP